MVTTDCISGLLFQELINAYGVAGYKEMNPAVYTIITFPFLFSVMFGDLGHGIIMTAFGVWMCLKEKQLQNRKMESEITRIFFGGRYLIALMGFFSMYAGIIYNDVFSKSINVFGSSWAVYQSNAKIMSTESDMITPANSKGWYGAPYMLGVDPVWQVSENKIVFLNAFKMKLSIILGVLHMLFGIVLSNSNHKFFRKPLNVVTEFIPQIIFLCCMFGYLALLMFHKWTSYYANSDPETFAESERCAPSILITFINMVLFKDNKAEEGCDAYMYAGQKGIQMILVLVSVLCVPWMLFAKPLAIRKEHR